MKDTFFYPTEGQFARLPMVYRRNPTGLVKENTALVTSGEKYYSGSGGLISSAEDYVQFGQMLLNGGQLNGKRLLSPKTVELMTSVHIPDTMAGRPRGRSFGLSMQVFNDAIAAGFSVSTGSFGWDGAFGTHFWVDPKEKLVGIMMVQTPGGDVARDFDTAVMQAIIE
jgi:CubicO group peptidase (beta-lactamase class C family)